MSSAKFAVPFRFSLKTSFLLAGSLVLMYGGAMSWLWSFALPVVFKLIGVVVIGAGFIVHLRRYVLMKGRRAVSELVWDGSDAWLMHTCAGENIQASLLGSTFVNPWLIILNFKTERGGRMWPVVIMPDSTDSTSFRRLTSRLRRKSGAAMESAV